MLGHYFLHSREQTLLCQQLTSKTERLSEVETRHQLMFSTNPWPMWIYDSETLRFLEVNDAAVQAYGFSREEFLAMTLLDIRPPEEASALMDAMSRRMDGLNSPRVWRHRRKDDLQQRFAERAVRRDLCPKAARCI
jgi:PAS domain S-box-containing protein